MAPLADQLATYARTHRHPANLAVHAVVVPVLSGSVLALLSAPPPFVVAGVEVRWSMVAVAALLIHYLRLDYALGVALAAAFTVLEVLALQAATDATFALAAGAAGTAAACTALLLAHRLLEPRSTWAKPEAGLALLAPLFLAARVAVALGRRPDLRRAVGQEQASS